MKNVLEYLERAAERYGDRPAVEDEHGALTWGEMAQRAKRIGSALLGTVRPGDRTAVCMPKCPGAVAAMLGSLYAGCCYTVLDPDMPPERAGTILRTFRPGAILCREEDRAFWQGLAGDGTAVLTGEGIPQEIREEALASVRQGQISTDLCYCLFTSGSTGIPKGVSIRHLSVIDLVEWALKELKVDHTFRFGNQAPLFFDNSVLDLYCAMAAGAAVHLIPRRLFLFPGRLVDYIEEKQLNTLFWVPSALMRLSESGAVRDGRPRGVRRVFFCGEVMSVRQLNLWRKSLPDADYVNMYGPTEICDVCAFYRVDREFDDTQALPIGAACDNTRLTLIDGEICVSGVCLSAGYFGDPEKTGQAFVRDPERPEVMDWVYRTGDLGRINDRGEMEFLGRNDSQIKRSGYRIELGEIETAARAMPGVENAVCVFLAEGNALTLFFTGGAEEKALKKQLKTRLPKYMLPDSLVRLDRMPETLNGKADRAALKAMAGKE